jgi:hypothetical protein
MFGSLTGAVAPKKVSGVCKGKLKLIIMLIFEYNDICLLDCEIYKLSRDYKLIGHIDPT